MRVIKRLEARANATLANANDGIDLAKDFVEDLKDGVGFTIRPRKGFSKFATRFCMSLIEYGYEVISSQIKGVITLWNTPGQLGPELHLEWMEEEDIPITVTLDPTIDARPPRIAKFSGGPYDGKEYVVDQSKTSLTLSGGATYNWDGHVFLFKG